MATHGTTQLRLRWRSTLGCLNYGTLLPHICLCTPMPSVQNNKQTTPIPLSPILFTYFKNIFEARGNVSPDCRYSFVPLSQVTCVSRRLSFSLQNVESRANMRGFPSRDLSALVNCRYHIPPCDVNITVVKLPVIPAAFPERAMRKKEGRNAKNDQPEAC